MNRHPFGPLQTKNLSAQNAAGPVSPHTRNWSQDSSAANMHVETHLSSIFMCEESTTITFIMYSSLVFIHSFSPNIGGEVSVGCAFVFVLMFFVVMYALCASGAVNVQFMCGSFVFLRYVTIP